MAKKPAKSATVTPIKRGSTSKPTPLAIRVESSSNDSIYVNYMEVGHSQYEFLLNMARVPAKVSAATLADAKERGALILEPDVSVIFPPRIISGLIKALEVQRDKYEAQFGKIGTTGELKDE